MDAYKEFLVGLGITDPLAHWMILLGLAMIPVAAISAAMAQAEQSKRRRELDKDAAAERKRTAPRRAKLDELRKANEARAYATEGPWPDRVEAIEKLDSQGLEAFRDAVTDILTSASEAWDDSLVRIGNQLPHSYYIEMQGRSSGFLTRVLADNLRYERRQQTRGGISDDSPVQLPRVGRLSSSALTLEIDGDFAGGSVALEWNPPETPRGRDHEGGPEDAKVHIAVADGTFVAGNQRDVEKQLATLEALPAPLLSEVFGAMGETGLRTFGLRGSPRGRAQLSAAFNQGLHAMSNPVAGISMAADLMARTARAAKELSAARGDAEPEEPTPDAG